MNTFRTTVNFDYDLHRQLRLQAASQGVSFSNLVNNMLSNKNLGQKNNAARSFEEDLTFFRKLAKKYGKVDWVKAVRDERDRDYT
jgi:hypothetical protein